MRGPPSPEAQRDSGAGPPGSDAGGDGGDDAAGLGLSEEASGNFKAGGFANETSTPTGGTSASDWESSSGTGTEGGPPSAPATPGRADAEPPLPDEADEPEEPEPEPEPPLETAESVERENDELREKLASRDEELARLHARLAEVEGETQVERGPAIALPPQQRSPRSRKPLSKAQQEYNEGLYRREQELMKEKKERMEARRQQYIDAELDGCTFAPKISNKAADFTTSNATKLVLTAEEKIERQTTQIGKIVRDAIASNRSLGGKAMKNIETVFKAIDKDVSVSHRLSSTQETVLAEVTVTGCGRGRAISTTKSSSSR